ncbi:antitoxin Xre-like helix-turn-helix domain-containing protein [Rhabdobacter roseus]|nr:antitoxin Xre-like helix-turn-helix domain-containing protein [Rhabdobacter roseus]
MQPLFPVRPDSPATKRIRQARRGVLRRQVDEVAQRVGLTDIEMARVLNMSVRSPVRDR